MLVLFVLLLLLPNGCDARKKKKHRRGAAKAAAATPNADVGADAAKAAAEAQSKPEASADAGSSDTKQSEGNGDGAEKKKKNKKDDEDEELDEWGEKPINRTLVESAFNADDEAVADLLDTKLPEDDMKPPYEPPHYYMGMYLGVNPDTGRLTFWLGMWQLDLLILLVLGAPAFALASVYEWLYPENGKQPSEESKRFQRNWKRQGLVYALRVLFDKEDGAEGKARGIKATKAQ